MDGSIMRANASSQTLFISDKKEFILAFDKLGLSPRWKAFVTYVVNSCHLGGKPLSLM